MECGKMLWPQQSQEKGFEKVGGLEAQQIQRYAALVFPQRSKHLTTQGRKIDFIYK